jgi:hypothetical protein
MSLRERILIEQAGLVVAIKAKASRVANDARELAETVERGSTLPTYYGLMGEEFARLITYVAAYEANAKVLAMIESMQTEAGSESLATAGATPCGIGGHPVRVPPAESL